LANAPCTPTVSVGDSVICYAELRIKELLMTHTIELPQPLYEALQLKAATERTTTDALVIEWVAARLGVGDRVLGLEEAAEADEDRLVVFAREEAAFERLKPSLLGMYGGEFVAIYGGRVVAHGRDKFAVLDEVRQQFGHVVCFVEQLTTEAPRSVRLPSWHV
jgi:hypothetical protein